MKKSVVLLVVLGCAGVRAEVGPECTPAPIESAAHAVGTLLGAVVEPVPAYWPVRHEVPAQVLGPGPFAEALVALVASVAGEAPVLDDTGLSDRWQLAREVAVEAGALEQGVGALLGALDEAPSVGWAPSGGWLEAHDRGLYRVRVAQADAHALAAALLRADEGMRVAQEPDGTWTFRASRGQAQAFSAWLDAFDGTWTAALALDLWHWRSSDALDAWWREAQAYSVERVYGRSGRTLVVLSHATVRVLHPRWPFVERPARAGRVVVPVGTGVHSALAPCSDAPVPIRVGVSLRGEGEGAELSVGFGAGETLRAEVVPGDWIVLRTPEGWAWGRVRWRVAGA